MFRRRPTSEGFVFEHRHEDGSWAAGPDPQLWESPFSARFELEAAAEHLRLAGGCLPFQPLSFRDFMVSEQHVVDASRGLVQRFHPGQARVTDAYEKLVRRDFPKFRPHRLFYRQPIYYMSNHVTFVPGGTPVEAPDYTHALDYELELGLVLARRLRDASPDEALGAIGAFVLVNDFSARDVQRDEMATGLGPQKSKHFLSSMSQSAATADEVVDRLDQLTGSVRINGEVVSSVSTDQMAWSVGELLAHASRCETLLPGELVATGTLAGGSGMETGHWLRDGDRLELELDGIGSVDHVIRRPT